jgi:tetratricopeptide (TPR) repeat protein
VLLAGGAVAVLAARTLQYQGVWQDELRLWGHAASVHPDAYYAWMKLGEVRRDRGAFDGSIRAYQHVTALDPRRKLGHVALFQSVALRDEHLRALPASAAESYARAYYAALDNPDHLRELATDLLARGYLRAAELPLGRALELQPFPDSALEHAAEVQFAAERPTLALLYLRHMRQPTRKPELLAAAAQARAALVTAPLL